MKLYAYGCPECGEWHKEIGGPVVNGAIQLRCRACGFVERIPKLPVEIGRVVQ